MRDDLKNNVHFSSESNEWETPQYVFDMLNEEFHFTLDAAATKENAKCAVFFTKENDGLKQNWGGQTVFCNPPYSQLKAWIQKARISARFGATTIMLIPARTDTAAFHDSIYKKPNVEVRFLRGRLKFGDSKNSAPFPSMVVVFYPQDMHLGN